MPDDQLLIDTGAAQETATIATIVTPAPPSPAPNVTLTAPLANAHAAGVAVAGIATYHTIALLIDTQGPGGDVGDAGDDAAAQHGDRGRTGRHRATRSSGSRARPAARPATLLQLDQGANAETGHDREHRHAYASRRRARTSC